MLFQKSVSNLPGRIEPPGCPKCKTPMMLARLSPSRERFELQYFDCPKCDHEVTVEVPELDPLKKAEGWLSGELGRSKTP
jgi:transposase-like protein